MRILLVAVLAAGATAGGALAQQAGSMSGSMQSMGKTTHSMIATEGTHTMPATITSLDQKTGLMEVDSAGMALKLHFPPASVAHLKTGDKITLHLGFTKP